MKKKKSAGNASKGKKRDFPQAGNASFKKPMKASAATFQRTAPRGR